MNWKAEVKVDGKWTRNGMVFPTQEDAEHFGDDLAYRWINVTETRAVPVDEKATHAYRGHDVVEISWRETA